MPKAKVLAVVLAIALLASAFSGCKEEEPPEPLNIINGIPEFRLGFDDMPENCDITGRFAEQPAVPFSTSTVSLSYVHPAQGYTAEAADGYNDSEQLASYSKDANIAVAWLKPDEETSYNDLVDAVLGGEHSVSADVVWDAHIFSKKNANRLLDEGDIIALNRYIEFYAPNLKALLLKYPEILSEISTADGRIYMFPQLTLDPRTRVTGGFQLRSDWLAVADVETPVTIADWDIFFEKIMGTVGASGGALKAEPFCASSRESMAYSLAAFAPAFGIADGLYIKNGVVKYGPLEPEYKDYLLKMREWYEKGYINKGLAENTIENIGEAVESSKAAAWYSGISGGMGRYLSRMSNYSSFSITPVNTPLAPDGVSYTVNSAAARTALHGASITSSNKNVIATVKWLDGFYSESLQNKYGQFMPLFSINDGIYQISDWLAEQVEEGMQLEQVAWKYAPEVFLSLPGVIDPDEHLALKMRYPKQVEAAELWAKQDFSLILPPLFFSIEEVIKNNTMLTNLNDYVNDYYIKFIDSTEHPDNYSMFVNKLKELGAEELVRIHQEAYDSYYK